MIKFDHFAERGPLKRLRGALNDMREDIKSLRIANGIGYTVKRTAIGQVLNIKARGVSGGGVRLVWVAITTVTEQFVQGNIGGSLEEIMRPMETWGDAYGMTGSDVHVWRRQYHLLQSSTNDTSAPEVSDDGNIRQYSVYLTNPATQAQEQQIITERLNPKYLVGDIILAAGSINENASGRTDDWEWVDLNIDARRWILWPQVTAVCIDNQTKYIYVQRSVHAEE